MQLEKSRECERMFGHAPNVGPRRSEVLWRLHHNTGGTMGFAALNPSYELRALCKKSRVPISGERAGMQLDAAEFERGGALRAQRLEQFIESEEQRIETAELPGAGE